jgi:NAD(P)-dependent dehydrogenase (short-subunit alcohol dehydrogenase family)
MEGFSTDDIVRMALDVTSDADVKRVVKHIVDTEGKIDIVVNNAGVSSPGESRTFANSPPYISFILSQALSLMSAKTMSDACSKRTHSRLYVSPGPSFRRWRSGSKG